MDHRMHLHVCNGSLDLRIGLLASLDDSFLFELHEYGREHQPGLERPNRENEWLQTDHMKEDQQ